MNSNEKMYHYINIIRKVARKSQVQWNNELADAARKRAEEISKGKFSHATEAEGKTVEIGNKHFTATGYETSIPNIQNYNLVGENLSRGFENQRFAFAALMKSPLHRKNILQDFTDVGIATVNGVTVQLYGRRG